MNNTALQTIATKALPALSGEQVTYNAAKNVFLSQGYTSAAGNMYYKAIRLSNRFLLIALDNVAIVLLILMVKLLVIYVAGSSP